MDMLLGGLVACALTGLGGRSQLLVILLGLRFPGRARTILIAALLAAAIATGIGAAGGMLVRDMMPVRGRSLLVALALILAGLGMMPRPVTPRLRISAGAGAFVASFGALLSAGIGDGAQFLAFALSAIGGAPWLATIGATLGVGAAALPAAWLGRRFVTVVPLRPLRIVIGLSASGIGAVIALDALRLL